MYNTTFSLFIDFSILIKIFVFFFFFSFFRLFSKSEENDMGVKRSSSETTVFEFRDSDSEQETSSNDLHSLNEMRKDRKTRTPSVTPTNIDQLDDVSFSNKIFYFKFSSFSTTFVIAYLPFVFIVYSFVTSYFAKKYFFPHFILF